MVTIDCPASVTERARERSARRWLRLLPLLAVALLVATGALLPRGTLQVLMVKLFGDTEYGSSFDEHRFAALPLGADEAEVRAALGAPLDDRSSLPETRWLYVDGADVDVVSTFASCGNCEGMVSHTIVCFDGEGRFVDVTGQLVVEAGAGTGQVLVDGSRRNGNNSLHLGASRIEALKREGATQADVEVRLGQPAARYESRAVRVLRFTRSPSGTHHFVREIGLDAQGRVCWKRSGIYWD